MNRSRDFSLIAEAYNAVPKKSLKEMEGSFSTSNFSSMLSTILTSKTPELALENLRGLKKLNESTFTDFIVKALTKEYKGKNDFKQLWEGVKTIILNKKVITEAKTKKTK